MHNFAWSVAHTMSDCDRVRLRKITAVSYIVQASDKHAFILNQANGSIWMITNPEIFKELGLGEAYAARALDYTQAGQITGEHDSSWQDFERFVKHYDSLPQAEKAKYGTRHEIM